MAEIDTYTLAEDHHTAILRAAYADLERTGSFQPREER